MSEKAENHWFNWHLMGFCVYLGIGSALFREFFTLGLGIPFSITSALGNLFLLLTAYPLFIRHIPSRWSKNNKPIKFSTWLFISLLISAFAFIFIYFVF